MNTSSPFEPEPQIRRLQILLSHLLKLRVPAGHALISADLFLQQVLDDCEGQFGWSGGSFTPHEIINFADGRGMLTLNSSNRSVLYGKIELHYRRLACGIGQPDWLCTKASAPSIIHPDFPVYYTDHETGIEYIFSIKRISRMERKAK